MLVVKVDLWQSMHLSILVQKNTVPCGGSCSGAVTAARCLDTMNVMLAIKIWPWYIITHCKVFGAEQWFIKLNSFLLNV